MTDESQNPGVKYALALIEEDRKRDRKGNWWLLLLVVAAVVGLGVVAVALLSFAAKALDARLSDDNGVYSAAWLRTRDVAPGDDVAISVAAQGRGEAITRIRVRLGDRELQLRRAPSEDSVDKFTFVFAIPEDAPLGSATLVMDLSLLMELPAQRDEPRGQDDELQRWAAKYQSLVGETRDTERSDQLRLALEVRSPRARTIRVVVDGALALGALLGAFGIAYFAGRFRRRSDAMKWPTIGEPADTPYAEEENDGFIFLGVLVMIAISMLGHLVFVRTLWRTTSIGSSVFMIVLLAIWLVAIVAGGYRGCRARTPQSRSRGPC